MSSSQTPLKNVNERKSFPVETLTHNEASRPFIYCLPACPPAGLLGILEISEGGKHKQLVSAEGNKFYSDEAIRRNTMKNNLSVTKESNSRQESGTGKQEILGNTLNGQ